MAAVVPAYSYRVVGTTPEGSEIRKFADARIAGAIDDAIASANLKGEQTTAIMVTYKDESATPGGGVLRGAVMKKLESAVPTWIPFLSKKKVEWSFVGVISHDFANSNTTKEADRKSVV